MLIDFSIASHPHYALVDEKNLGTPGYMAPEQYEGREVPASDQFALAVIALQMLTGRRPLPGSATASLKQIERWRDTKHEEIVQLLGNRTHTADVLRRALAYDPAARDESCEIFADQLRRALVQDGESVQSQPGSVKRTSPVLSQSKPPAFPPFVPGWIGVGIAVAIGLVMLILAVATPASREQAVPTAPAATATLVAVTAAPTPPQATLAPPAVQSTLVPAGAAGAAGSVTIISREPLRAQFNRQQNPGMDAGWDAGQSNRQQTASRLAGVVRSAVRRQNRLVSQHLLQAVDATHKGALYGHEHRQFRY